MVANFLVVEGFVEFELVFDKVDFFVSADGTNDCEAYFVEGGAVGGS